MREWKIRCDGLSGVGILPLIRPSGTFSQSEKEKLNPARAG